jgi:phenylalanyl-tRNA synthetase beta chain
LRASLQAIGQRSINNVVDATNYVMFNIGQPLHAFDAGKLVSSKDGPRWGISVRRARAGEKMLALDEKEYALSSSMLVIVDQHSDEPVGIAGVKGGMPSGITEATTDIIIESANFNGASVRKTAQALRLRTDASTRFEQVISPELAAYGMRAVVELIQQLAGGEVVGSTDIYLKPQEKREVRVTLERINAVLGMKFVAADVADVFTRLGLPFTQDGGSFTVTPAFARLDLAIPEDLIEEVGRITGYDKIPNVELPPSPHPPEVNKNFYAAEKVREELLSLGYSEVITSVFADKGERVVANKVDGVRPFLRSNLIDGLAEALKKNIPNKDLLGLKEIKLFEIGAVWRDGKELTMVGTIGEKEKASEKPLEPIDASRYEDFPISDTERYKTFSRYPFIVRDIALWTSTGTNADEVLDLIRKNGSELLVRSEKFDEFKKDDKTSYAFRLIFQSFEKTLTDAEVNSIMEKIGAAVGKRGWEVR